MPNKKEVKKKPTPKKETTKKTTPKKKPAKQEKKKNIKEIVFNKNNILYYLFFTLLIIVIVLGVLVFRKTQEKNDTANMLIPILHKDQVNDLNIDVKELAKQKDYSIKISNFRQDILAEEEISYSITVNNTTGAIIKVTKDEDPDNLIVDQQSTRIDGMKFGNKKKEYSIYYFSIIDNKNVNNEDKISIKIESS